MHKWIKLERDFRTAGYKYICGVDEAGRGPLAGPVTAAAVILPDDFEDYGIKDSKLLSEKNRLKLFEYIIANCRSYSIAHALPEEIDDLNILQATFLAMRRAIAHLNIPPDFVLVDGNLKIAKLKTPQQTIVAGDKKVLSIASASILAKVSRDRIMYQYQQKFPEYGFGRHKGYPTKEHRRMIIKHGVCGIHRRSFNLLGKDAEMELSFGHQEKG